MPLPPVVRTACMTLSPTRSASAAPLSVNVVVAAIAFAPVIV
ncbi:MAG: hypothetical protein WDO24_16985 [Pseudomonadota bacterium]